MDKGALVSPPDPAEVCPAADAVEVRTTVSLRVALKVAAPVVTTSRANRAMALFSMIARLVSPRSPLSCRPPPTQPNR